MSSAVVTLQSSLLRLEIKKTLGQNNIFFKKIQNNTHFKIILKLAQSFCLFPISVVKTEESPQLMTSKVPLYCTCTSHAHFFTSLSLSQSHPPFFEIQISKVF